ncbi:MAG: hypothetical protein AAGJ81_10575 [Verrucomicrobiota bacterium]
MSKGTNIWYEKDLADRLGLQRNILARARRNLKLKEGEGFGYGPSGRIYLTVQGRKAVFGELEIEEPEEERGSDSEKNSARGAESGGNGRRWTPPKSREGSFVRALRNPKLIEVRLEGEEACTLVRVQSNANFTAGMTVRARPPMEGSVWYLEGRCPRYRGRW